MGTGVPAVTVDLRTAIEQALIDMGLWHDPSEYDSSIHDWRCEHPDRYGPCTCFADTVDHVLAAIRTHVRNKDSNHKTLAP